MSSPPFDIPKAHRWFAVELNNLAWDLTDAEQRSPADVDRMIDAAHAACFHWAQIGDVLNRLRAQTLLATVYAKAGFAEPAVRHAQRVLELSHEAGTRQSAFDRACAHGCASAAYTVANQVDEAKAQHAMARIAVEKFDEASEREVFERYYPPPIQDY